MNGQQRPQRSQGQQRGGQGQGQRTPAISLRDLILGKPKLIRDDKYSVGVSVMVYANNNPATDFFFQFGLDAILTGNPQMLAGGLASAKLEIPADGSCLTIMLWNERLGITRVLPIREIDPKILLQEQEEKEKKPEQEATDKKTEKLKLQAKVLEAETEKIKAETGKINVEKAKAEVGKPPSDQRAEELKLQAKVIQAEKEKLEAETEKLKAEKAKAETEIEKKQEPFELIVDPTRIGNNVNLFVRVVDEEKKGVPKARITIVDGGKINPQPTDEYGEYPHSFVLQEGEEREIAIYVAGYGERGYRQTFRGRRVQNVN